MYKHYITLSYLKFLPEKYHHNYLYQINDILISKS